MRPIRIVLLSAALLSAGCAVEKTHNISPSYSYEKDASIGLEAESIGNYSLARSFLETALEKDDEYRVRTVYEDNPVLSDGTRAEALSALSRIYYRTGDIDALYDHLHRYWKVTDLHAVPWVSEAEERANYEYHLNWYCRLLDDQERFSEAQACWAKLGNQTRAEASIRAFELQEVFGRR